MPSPDPPRRPLSEHAIRALGTLRFGPEIRFLINPGVANRLLGEGLVEAVVLPDPGRGRKNAAHLKITDAGLKRWREINRG